MNPPAQPEQGALGKFEHVPGGRHDHDDLRGKRCLFERGIERCIGFPRNRDGDLFDGPFAGRGTVIFPQLNKIRRSLMSA